FQNDFGELTGQPCWAGFKGLDSKCPNCQVERTFADGLPHRSEEVWTLPGRGDRRAYVMVHTSPILDENGNVREVLEMAVDITRVEKLKTELKKKEEEFKNLFETVPCYLTVVDPSFRIAFYNKLFAKKFGDRWGKKCYEVYKGREEKCRNCPVEKTFLDGMPHSSEDTWIHNGEEIHLVINTAPVTDENGMIVAVMEMCTNITELKALRSELAVLGETIAGMSHAVKNILAGLEGGVYVVDSGLKDGREAKVRTGWDMVKRNVKKVSELVRDILYASKEREPQYDTCDPGKILGEVYELYRKKAQDLGVELILNVPSELGVAWLDPRGIHSAVSNLVSNAIGACIDCEVEKKFQVVLSGFATDNRLIIQVSDNGIGMSEEIRDNLFQKFYSTKGAKGTGLGLVVTKKIIEEHGGNVRVGSWLGEGTTFTIEIPLKSDAHETKEELAV
ncbi:MAG: PAS domain-containing protein, partial [Deltaproteobacteria bacterium]|nr:PAS domain-containing protein [Deltaproteobacteria bacterium]